MIHEVEGAELAGDVIVADDVVPMVSEIFFSKTGDILLPRLHITIETMLFKKFLRINNMGTTARPFIYQNITFVPL